MKHDYTQPQIWDKIWARPYKNYEKHHQVFWHEIVNRSSGRVIDLGCGSGSMWKIPKPDGIIDVTGFDFAPSGIAEAQKNCPYGHFKVADLTSLPYNFPVYDTTILCGIVNYYHDLTPVMKQAHTVTKSGGRILVTINVIDDFPDRHWDEERIKKEFTPYGNVRSKFYPKIGWLIDILKV